MLLLPMFLRSTNRKKDGKTHRYFSVVENRRLPGSRIVQRTVLYLGEINDQQQAAWRSTLEVFDEDEQDYRTMSLFPDDREVPADVLDSIQVNSAATVRILDGSFEIAMRLRSPSARARPSAS